MPSTDKIYTVSNLKGLPFIGMFFRVKNNPVDCLMDFSRNNGDIILFKVMGHTAIQLNHPDLVRQVLIDNHKNYKKNKIYVRFESAIGLGLLTSNGEKWKRDRQKIQPMFNREKIAGYYFEVVNEVSEKFKRKWLSLTKNNSVQLNITREMANITIEIILKSIFGKDINDETLASLHQSYDALIEYLKHPRIFYNADLGKIFHSPSYRRFKRELDNIDNRIKQLAEQYRNEGLSDKYNMLALLIEAQKKDPENFSEKDIRDHAVSMVFAGFESTSILMQWVWYALDEQAAIREKIVQNITTHAPCTATDDSSAITLDAINQMDYLALALKEVMRIYPPFWFTGREAIEDDHFGNFQVKRGATIIVPPLAMHRHPRWWKEPDRFIPERFLSTEIDEGLYFPFSQGPRKCAGQTFVEMEAKTVIAKLLPLFKVTALNKSDNAIYGGISLKLAHPLMVEISRAS